jgi:hypothetical protein
VTSISPSKLSTSGSCSDKNAVGLTANFLLQYAVKSTFYDKTGPNRVFRPVVMGRVTCRENPGVSGQNEMPIPGLGPDGGVEQNFVQ